MWLGLALTIDSFSFLTGDPIAGAIIRHQQGSYLGAQLFSGIALTVGSTILVAGRVYAVGWKPRVVF